MKTKNSVKLLVYYLSSIIFFYQYSKLFNFFYSIINYLIIFY